MTIMRRTHFYVRRIICALLFIVIVYAIVSVIKAPEEIDRKATLNKIDEVIKSHVVSGPCKRPDLPINSSEIMRFIKDVPPIRCDTSEPNWVTINGSDCIINTYAKSNYPDVKCTFTDIIREYNDYKFAKSKPVEVEDRYKLIASDVVQVDCTSQKKSWSGVLTGIRYDSALEQTKDWSLLSSDALPINVLMFGFDSLSRNTFIRKLPKSYKYLTETLGAIVLKGYNIVGDGTPQALIPILTGRTELELPETRKRKPQAKYVNVYPFIWNDFNKNGYVTGFLEDLPNAGTFTYRLQGFKKQPTEHYLRLYYLAAQSFFKRSPNLCAGSVPKHKVMLDYIKEFFTVYKNKPKFLFGFHGELSHDSYNLIGAADNDVLEWLQSLHSSGTLNNTILIMMADHGHRFADIRNTMQGKQEERMPFFSFTFPNWFKTKFPQAYANFKRNKDMLTTPFDIYSTLKHLLNWKDFTMGDLKHRSISLFNQIPLSRNCADAYIEPHWCTCLEWHQISAELPVVSKLVKTFEDTINTYTQLQRDLCHVLTVKNVLWVTELSPNNNLVHFRKNADYDGFVGEFSANTKIDSTMYQFKVETIPGNGLYEASITHYLKNDKFILKISDISRINMYGPQANCIMNIYPHLRKYCYCRNT